MRTTLKWYPIVQLEFIEFIYYPGKFVVILQFDFPFVEVPYAPYKNQQYLEVTNKSSGVCERKHDRGVTHMWLVVLFTGKDIIPK